MTEPKKMLISGSYKSHTSVTSAATDELVVNKWLLIPRNLTKNISDSYTDTLQMTEKVFLWQPCWSWLEQVRSQEEGTDQTIVVCADQQ